MSDSIRLMTCRDLAYYFSVHYWYGGSTSLTPLIYSIFVHFTDLVTDLSITCEVFIIIVVIIIMVVLYYGGVRSPVCTRLLILFNSYTNPVSVGEVLRKNVPDTVPLETVKRGESTTCLGHEDLTGIGSYVESIHLGPFSELDRSGVRE